jgi:CxxC motif-containing protein
MPDMKKVNLICIGCPLGCPLEVEMEGAEVLTVTGQTCKNGEKYARKELTNPTRIVTSTVRVTGGTLAMVSVKTASDIPKGRIFDCVRELQAIDLTAPVAIGDVIIENVCGTGVSIVATKNVPVR